VAIISFKHKFIFLKTRKVAGTSVEAALRRYAGQEDIVPCVTPRDELFSIAQGHPARNYARNREDELRYAELVSQERFDDAMEHLKRIDKKYVSHMDARRLKVIVEELGYRFEDFYRFTIDRHPYTWMISSAAYNNAKYNKGTLSPIGSGKILKLIKERLQDPKFLGTMNWNMYTIDGEVQVDRIIRYETLQEELPDTLRGLGLDVEGLALPDLKANVRHLSPDEILDPETKSAIYEAFEQTFEALGYEP